MLKYFSRIRIACGRTKLFYFDGDGLLHATGGNRHFCYSFLFPLHDSLRAHRGDCGVCTFILDRFVAVCGAYFCIQIYGFTIFHTIARLTDGDGPGLRLIDRDRTACFLAGAGSDDELCRTGCLACSDGNGYR